MTLKTVNRLLSVMLLSMCLFTLAANAGGGRNYVYVVVALVASLNYALSVAQTSVEDYKKSRNFK